MIPRALLACCAVLVIVGCLTPLPQSPTSTPHPTPTATDPANPGATPTPTSAGQTLGAGELRELRAYALELVNRDRADHGLPPVTLGTNAAAQYHAEDMLDHGYIGHWWVDGRKPYMVYTQSGGTTYASENAGSGGWTAARWEEERCGSLLVNCQITEPREQIERLEYGMMYDDAHANWGHRDNILDPGHTSVSIGIAWDGRRTTFAQHFEGGLVRADAAPSLTPDGTLSFSLTKLAPGLTLANVVSVYHDPPPTPRTPEEIDSLGSYCLGGGFTATCADSIASILKPPPSGSSYRDLGPTDFVAGDWTETADGFAFSVSAPLFREPGVYSIAVWRDDGGPQLTQQLVALSAFQE